MTQVCPKCGSWKKRESQQCFSCRFSRPTIVQASDAPFRYIALTKGQITVVDAEDYERINAYRWRATWNPGSSHFYAVRCVRTSEGTKTVILAREIMGLCAGEKITVDHINPDETLDNRKSNLRLATTSQQGMNKHRISRNSTGFKGVSWDKRSNKFRAIICLNKKLIHLGFFGDAALAHEAYKIAAIEYHGEFARSN